LAGDINKDKKGFSGLLDLASDLSDINEPKAEVSPSTPKQRPQPQQEAFPPKPERKNTNPPPIKTESSGKSGGGSGGKWVLCIIGFIFVILLINNGVQSNRKNSYTPPSSSKSDSYPQIPSALVVQTPITTHYRDWSLHLYEKKFKIVNLLSSDTLENLLLVSFYRDESLFFNLYLSVSSSYVPYKNEKVKLYIYIDNKHITTSIAKISQYEQKLLFEIDINFQAQLLELFKKGKEVQFYLENKKRFCSFSLYGFTKLYNVGLSELYKN